MSYPKRIRAHIQRKGDKWLAGARCDYKKDSCDNGHLEFNPDFVCDVATYKAKEFITVDEAVKAANEFAAMLCKGKTKLWVVDKKGATYPSF